MAARSLSIQMNVVHGQRNCGETCGMKTQFLLNCTGSCSEEAYPVWKTPPPSPGNKGGFLRTKVDTMEFTGLTYGHHCHFKRVLQCCRGTLMIGPRWAQVGSGALVIPPPLEKAHEGEAKNNSAYCVVPLLHF